MKSSLRASSPFVLQLGTSLEVTREHYVKARRESEGRGRKSFFSHELSLATNVELARRLDERRLYSQAKSGS